jgi:hypothetical protein
MREAKAAARAAGKIPVLPSDVAEIDALVCAAQRFVDSLRTTEPAIHAMMQPDGGKSEVVLVWEGRRHALQAARRPDRDRLPDRAGLQEHRAVSRAAGMVAHDARLPWAPPGIAAACAP